MSFGGFVATKTHLENARIFGEHRAQREKEMGFNVPNDSLWLVLDPNDVLFRITGEKNVLDYTDAQDILNEIEDAYFDEWDSE